MKKLAIFQFEPIIGGESTLCSCLYKILRKHYRVKIYHPCEVENEKMKVSTIWHAVEDGKFIPYLHVPKICEIVDYSIFLNSIHTNTKTLYSSISSVLKMYTQIQNCNLIFYEHGLHTYNHCEYELLFSILSKQNKIRILTNTNEAIKIYEEKGLKAFLCRQPFIAENYKPIQTNTSSRINFCFNSRFSTSKLVHKSIDYFSEFLNDDSLNFDLTYRHSGKEHEQMEILKNEIRNSKNGILKDYASDISEIYNKQDFCLFWGYDEEAEIGKLEYSLLEAFHYEIPVIVHPAWLRKFKYEEYGYSKEFIKECFIPLDPYTFLDILKNPTDYRKTVNNAKLILEDFSEPKILEKIQLCLLSIDI